MKKIFSWLGLTLASALFAAPIPREAPQRFVTEGFFQGGDPTPANLEAIRVARHATFERWVLDFSDINKRGVGKTAPELQVNFIPAKDDEDGPRLRVLLRRIHKNFVPLETRRRLAKQSGIVQDVIIYPSIEDGDSALELLFKPGLVARFKTHRPLAPSGKLVIDIAAE